VPPSSYGLASSLFTPRDYLGSGEKPAASLVAAAVLERLAHPLACCLASSFLCAVGFPKPPVGGACHLAATLRGFCELLCALGAGAVLEALLDTLEGLGPLPDTRGGIRCTRGGRCGARICSLLFTCSSTCWSPITSPCATAKTRPAACPFPRNPSTSATAVIRAARTPATTVERPAPLLHSVRLRSASHSSYGRDREGRGVCDYREEHLRITA